MKPQCPGPRAAKHGVPALATLLLAGLAGGAQVRNATRLGDGLAAGPANPSGAAAGKLPSFPDFYAQYNTGPGIWKWNNALVAYQRHMSRLQGTECSVAEVGVQSGGSIQMWHRVLGAKSMVHGIDINPKTKKFEDATTTVTIGDQADVNMWNSFFAGLKKPLDVLVDDGGHEPQQMLVTLQEAFRHIGAGGLVAIEDIHGERYLESFFKPAAHFLASEAGNGNLDSVHVYPFLLIAQRKDAAGKAPAALTFQGAEVAVTTFEEMWGQVKQHPGDHVVLENPGWGPFFTGQGLTNFFAVFAGLHTSRWYDNPAGCALTSAAICTNTVLNDPQQAVVTGIHIYPTRLVVEVAAQPALIQAVRKGDTWIKYLG